VKKPCPPTALSVVVNERLVLYFFTLVFFLVQKRRKARIPPPKFKDPTFSKERQDYLRGNRVGLLLTKKKKRRIMSLSFSLSWSTQLLVFFNSTDMMILLNESTRKKEKKSPRKEDLGV